MPRLPRCSGDLHLRFTIITKHRKYESTLFSASTTQGMGRLAETDDLSVPTSMTKMARPDPVGTEPSANVQLTAVERMKYRWVPTPCPPFPPYMFHAFFILRLPTTSAAGCRPPKKEGRRNDTAEPPFPDGRVTCRTPWSVSGVTTRVRQL